jgi:hypothetical protein
MANMSYEKKDLEIKADYYKKELNKLVEEFEAVRS